MADMTGIRRKGNQYEVNVRVKGDLRTAYYPLSTPVDTMQEWRAREKGMVAPAPVGGSFGDDILTYAADHQELPTIHQRTAHLWAWARALGQDRNRHSITGDDIDRIIKRWLETPVLYGKGKKGRPAPNGLGPATVRKRRTSLMAFFKALNGPKAVNPVKGTINPVEPKAEARGVDLHTLLRIIAAMPDWKDTKPGAPKVRSLSKIRARIMAFTGLPPGIIGTLTADDWNLRAKKVFVPARLKGGGIEARPLDLSDDALAAFQDLDAAQGYGAFAEESFNRTIKRAARKVDATVKNFHAYDLRHSHLSHAYLITKDEATVARLGLHAEGSRMTARYTRAAHAEVDKAAVKAFSESVAQARRDLLKPAVVPAAPRLTKKRKAG